MATDRSTLVPNCTNPFVLDAGPPQRGHAAAAGKATARGSRAGIGLALAHHASRQPERPAVEERRAQFQETKTASLDAIYVTSGPVSGPESPHAARHILNVRKSVPSGIRRSRRINTITLGNWRG